jgi:hypothetical protein
MSAQIAADPQVVTNRMQIMQMPLNLGIPYFKYVPLQS